MDNEEENYDDCEFMVGLIVAIAISVFIGGIVYGIVMLSQWKGQNELRVGSGKLSKYFSIRWKI